MKPDAFIQGMKEGVPSFIVCSGEETFFKEQVAAEVRAALRAREPRLQEIVWEALSGENPAAEARRLIEEIRTPGLFSPAKLIIARDGRKMLEAGPDGFLDLAEADPSANTLLLFAPSIDGRTSLARRLKKQGALVECRRLYAQSFFGRGGAERSELSQWVAARASARGLRLDPGAAAFLIELAGDSLFAIDSELQKLQIICEKGERVDIRRVEESTGMSAAHTAFDLWQKMEEGAAAAAVETLRVILRNGLRTKGGASVSDPGGIAAILLATFRDRIRLAALALVKTYEKCSEAEIQAAIGVASGFAFRKVMDYSKRLTPQKYALLNQAVLDAERSIKRQGLMPAVVLEAAVVRIATIHGARG